MREQETHLGVQVPNSSIRLQIHAVIVVRLQAILFVSSILTLDNDLGLDRSEA